MEAQKETQLSVTYLKKRGILHYEKAEFPSALCCFERALELSGTGRQTALIQLENAAINTLMAAIHLASREGLRLHREKAAQLLETAKQLLNGIGAEDAFILRRAEELTQFQDTLRSLLHKNQR